MSAETFVNMSTKFLTFPYNISFDKKDDKISPGTTRHTHTHTHIINKAQESISFCWINCYISLISSLENDILLDIVDAFTVLY